MLDVSRHTVPLEDIYFDTFDGSYLPFLDADEAVIERLRDVIPPLVSPKYVTGGRWMDADDLVIGYESDDGNAWAYPLKILNFHELVSDELDGVPILVTYCPLCRSAIIYDRRLDGATLNFGNTSALYGSDLVIYDRETNSYWWQIAGEAIVGELAGERLTAVPSITTTWDQWIALHPETKILSQFTGTFRPYDRDEFPGYEEQLNALDFPAPVPDALLDARLPAAEIVLGVAANGARRAYPVGLLGDQAVNDTLGGLSIVVFSSIDGPSGGAYEAQVEGRNLTFSFEDGHYVDDGTQSQWDLAGRAVSGQLEGAELTPLATRYTFWFGYIAAFPDSDLFTVD